MERITKLMLQLPGGSRETSVYKHNLPCVRSQTSSVEADTKEPTSHLNVNQNILIGENQTWRLLGSDVDTCKLVCSWKQHVYCEWWRLVRSVYFHTGSSGKGDEYEYSCRREHQSLWREEVNKVSEVRTTSAVFYLHRVLTESFSVL